MHRTQHWQLYDPYLDHLYLCLCLGLSYLCLYYWSHCNSFAMTADSTTTGSMNSCRKNCCSNCSSICLYLWTSLPFPLSCFPFLLPLARESTSMGTAPDFASFLVSTFLEVGQDFSFHDLATCWDTSAADNFCRCRLLPSILILPFQVLPTFKSFSKFVKTTLTWMKNLLQQG